MKSLRFSRDSWHYKLLNKMFGYEVYSGEEIDLCSYTWYVIGAIFLCLVAFVITFIVSIIVVNFVLGVGFSLVYWTFLFNEAGFGGLLVFVAAVIVLAFTSFSEWLRNRKHRTRPVKPDGFVKNAYKGLKEQYCSRVVFDDVTEVNRDEGNMV